MSAIQPPRTALETPERGLGFVVGGRPVAPRGVIHVGAHHGEEAEYYDSHGVATVAWIEAEPDAFDVLSRRVASLPGHHCIEALAGERDDEERAFYRHRFPGGAKRGFCSTLPWRDERRRADPVLSRLETFEVRPMRVSTVATALRERGLSPSMFQYLAINVQGAEIMVLRGLGEYLPAIEWIYCEAELDRASSRYEGAPVITEVADWLAARGFRGVEPALGRQRLFVRGKGGV